MLKGHGDDIHDFPGGIDLNFSSNVWYGGPPAELLDEIRNNLDNIVHYPEPEAEALRDELAEFHGVTSEYIQVTSGASEAIHLSGRIYAGGVALIVVPTFSEYADACIAGQMDIRYFSFPGYDGKAFDFSVNESRYFEGLNTWTDELRREIRKVSPHIVFLCNPNNPGGEYISADHLRSIARDHPGVTFIIDEAYLGFLDEPESVFDSKNPQPGVVVIRSLTKTFAIPGLRLGYMLGDPEILEKIRALRIPWSVNAQAIAAGKWIVRNGIIPRFDRKAVLRESETFASSVDAISGFHVRRSSTHYFLVRMDSAGTGQLKKDLAVREKILIRDASNFRGLDARWFRLSTRSKADNNILVNALGLWSEGKH